MPIRLATAADIQALALLRWDFRAEDGEIPVESKESFLARYAAFLGPELYTGRWTYWVAEDAGEMVGQLAIGIIPGVPRPSRLSDSWGYLTDSYVRPGHRNQGIGSGLLAAAVAWAAAKDLELLLVFPSDRAGPFYRRAGFERHGEMLTLQIRAFDHSEQ